MEKKKCFKCGQIKPLSDYYKHPQMGDGHLNKCKECTKKDSIKHRNNNIEKARQYDRDRSNLPHRVEARKIIWERYKKSGKRKEVENRYNKKYREKQKARRRVQYYLSKGTLKREPCKICGNEKTEAHHPDYNYPLNIVWLCDRCHKDVHNKIREENRYKGE